MMKGFPNDAIKIDGRIVVTPVCPMPGDGCTVLAIFTNEAEKGQANAV
jgi:hypothetical protein